MPPKKKAKASAPAAATPAETDDSLAVDTPPGDEEKPIPESLKDPWTDEQETSLFKSIIKWKPAGKRDQLVLYRWNLTGVYRYS
jgi:MRG-binding protein